MDLEMHSSWKTALAAEFDKPYFKELLEFVSAEYQTQICYPPKAEIFAAFANPISEVKVVIIGQDPYHQPDQANGFCFSVNSEINFPPSLRNIFEEIKQDIGTEKPLSGDLKRWANQGVLLLNATLTVRESAAGSHQKKGWEKFTDAVIEVVSNLNSDVVFLLWGSYAKKKGAKVDKSKHLVLESGHPSPLSANNGHWFGNKHFSKTNDFLRSKGKMPINW